MAKVESSPGIRQHFRAKTAQEAGGLVVYELQSASPFHFVSKALCQ